MATTKAAPAPVEITDPNNIPETVITGPFNIMRTDAMVLFTFTVVRQDATEVFAGNNSPSSKGVVAARILMSTQLAEELSRVLTQNLAAGAKSATERP
jgi:hypothetical protein